MGATEPIIRIADHLDWDEICAHLSNAGLPTMGLEEHLASTLLLKNQPGILACAALELYLPDALLRSVAVSGSARGQGFGRQITSAALQLAAQRGANRVYLITLTAADYFGRFGFRPVERSAVPGPIRHSVEFTTACPSTAQVMELCLR